MLDIALAGTKGQINILICKLLIRALWSAHHNGFEEAFRDTFNKDCPFYWGEMQAIERRSGLGVLSDLIYERLRSVER